MKEIQHTQSGGIGEHVVCGLVTGGMGFLLPVEDTHKVVVEHNGQFGTGKGETHDEATRNAIHDLNRD